MAVTQDKKTTPRSQSSWTGSPEENPHGTELGAIYLRAGRHSPAGPGAATRAARAKQAPKPRRRAQLVETGGTAPAGRGVKRREEEGACVLQRVIALRGCLWGAASSRPPGEPEGRRGFSSARGRVLLRWEGPELGAEPPGGCGSCWEQCSLKVIQAACTQTTGVGYWVSLQLWSNKTN